MCTTALPPPVEELKTSQPNEVMEAADCDPLEAPVLQTQGSSARSDVTCGSMERGDGVFPIVNADGRTVT
jgi:hypothetical protein